MTLDNLLALARKHLGSGTEDILALLQNRSDLAVSVEWLLRQVATPIHDGSDGSGVVSDYAYRHAMATRALTESRRP